MITLTHEIIAMTRRFVAGVRLDDEALAVNVIHEVGPGGEFMSHAHTLAHWRELWLPQIFDRQRLGSWQERGAKDVNVRVRDLTIALMNEHEVEPLPDSVEAERIDSALNTCSIEAFVTNLVRFEENRGRTWRW
jgi:trimethylamine--corrinoid protein Co-methyltransferase